jgi:hypothetical protein
LIYAKVSVCLNFNVVELNSFSKINYLIVCRLVAAGANIKNFV